jgi:hypothetical protein
MANGDVSAIWSTLVRRGEETWIERELAPASSGRQVEIRRLFRGHDYGAPHYDKACIYTFLAWLEPPGRSLSVSVQARAFATRLPRAERFAKWFIDLYQLVPRATPHP